MESLEQVNISNFNTSNVTDMSFMFGCGAIAYNCKLSEIQGLTNLDTSNVTTMQAMFVNQKNLRTLDLSSFNTPKLTNTNYMFLATNLTTIYVSSGFDVSKVTSSAEMFAKSGAGLSASTNYVLTGGRGTTYNSSHVDKEYARIDDPDNGRPGYFTLKTN